MQILPLVTLGLGFLIFWRVDMPADATLARYLAIAILAGLDTILGGLRAWLMGDYDDAVFVSGFFLNGLLAVAMVALGEQLGLEAGLGDSRISVMMIGAVVVFSGRILNNLAYLRRIVITRLREREAQRRSTNPVLGQA